MKKFVLFTLSGVVLSGCQMTNDQANLANTDFDSMTCDEIKQSFDEYHKQIDDIDNGSSLLSVVGVETDTSEARTAMLEIEMKAKEAARPALKAKQCGFTV
mgnify:CR=1 FL=1